MKFIEEDSSNEQRKIINYYCQDYEIKKVFITLKSLKMKRIDDNKYSKKFKCYLLLKIKIMIILLKAYIPRTNFKLYKNLDLNQNWE